MSKYFICRDFLLTISSQNSMALDFFTSLFVIAYSKCDCLVACLNDVGLCGEGLASPYALGCLRGDIGLGDFVLFGNLGWKFLDSPSVVLCWESEAPGKPVEYCLLVALSPIGISSASILESDGLSSSTVNGVRVTCVYTPVSTPS